MDLSFHDVIKVEVTNRELLDHGLAYRVIIVTTADGKAHEISLFADNQGKLTVEI